MSIKLNIKSDFTDFYDYLADQSANITYHRYISKKLDKSESFIRLRSLGIKTIEAKSVDRINSKSGYIVVYNDGSKHDGSGLLVLADQEAKMLYPNSLATEFYTESQGIVNRLLQIGKRRFRIFLKYDTTSIGSGKKANYVITNIDEIEPMYNHAVGLPIFSIDYIPTNNGILGLTFNNVEDISKSGVQQMVKAEDIISEIYSSLIMYNKI